MSTAETKSITDSFEFLNMLDDKRSPDYAIIGLLAIPMLGIVLYFLVYFKVNTNDIFKYKGFML